MIHTEENNPKLSIDVVIEYMESTSEASWCEKVVRTKEGGNCFFGHLFAMGKDEEESNLLWNWFEECYSTTYMIYPINDGEHPNYQESTPKQRVLSYLKNLRDKKEMTTYESMDYEMAEYEKSKQQ
jgi:hypothetical protein